jgi:hypothetical protein
MQRWDGYQTAPWLLGSSTRTAPCLTAQYRNSTSGTHPREIGSEIDSPALDADKLRSSVAKDQVPVGNWCPGEDGLEGQEAGLIDGDREPGGAEGIHGVQAGRGAARAEGKHGGDGRAWGPTWVQVRRW